MKAYSLTSFLRYVKYNFDSIIDDNPFMAIIPFSTIPLMSALSDYGFKIISLFILFVDLLFCAYFLYRLHPIKLIKDDYNKWKYKKNIL